VCVCVRVCVSVLLDAKLGAPTFHTAHDASSNLNVRMCAHACVQARACVCACMCASVCVCVVSVRARVCVCECERVCMWAGVCMCEGVFRI